MIIAAHCLKYENREQSYLLESLLVLAGQQPHHHFIVLTETIIAVPEHLKNIECLKIQPAIKNKLSLQYWYRFKMPGILINKKVNIFISDAGMLCKKLPFPQYIFLSPENKRQTPSRKIDNFAYHYPKLFATEVSRAKAIFITNPSLAIKLKNKQVPAYPVYQGLPDIYKPIGFEEKEKWKENNLDGCDYFVFHVSETTKAQVLPMLKAFSIFKKWTESSMKLVLVLHCPFSEIDIPKFNLYKFRKELEFIKFKDDEAAAALYAAAFLHIYLPGTLADESFALHALQTQSALLTSDSETEQLRFGSAAAYCSLNEKAIAEKLLYYYKNDFEKDNLISRSGDLLKNYFFKNSATQLSNFMGI